MPGLSPLVNDCSLRSQLAISISYNMPLNCDDPSDDDEEHIHGEAQAAAQNRNEMTIQNILGCKSPKHEIVSVPWVHNL